MASPENSPGSPASLPSTERPSFSARAQDQVLLEDHGSPTNPFSSFGSALAARVAGGGGEGRRAEVAETAARGLSDLSLHEKSHIRLLLLPASSITLPDDSLSRGFELLQVDVQMQPAPAQHPLQTASRILAIAQTTDDVKFRIDASPTIACALYFDPAGDAAILRNEDMLSAIEVARVTPSRRDGHDPLRVGAGMTVTLEPRRWSITRGGGPILEVIVLHRGYLLMASSTSKTTGSRKRALSASASSAHTQPPSCEEEAPHSVDASQIPKKARVGSRDETTADVVIAFQALERTVATDALVLPLLARQLPLGLYGEHPFLGLAVGQLLSALDPRISQGEAHADRYTIVKGPNVGVTHAAAVFRAHHSGLGKTVAVKVLKTPSLDASCNEASHALHRSVIKAAESWVNEYRQHSRVRHVSGYILPTRPPASLFLCLSLLTRYLSSHLLRSSMEATPVFSPCFSSSSTLPTSAQPARGATRRLPCSRAPWTMRGVFWATLPARCSISTSAVFCTTTSNRQIFYTETQGGALC